MHTTNVRELKKNPSRALRPALAASLYGSGGVSLGKAARISGLSLSEFVDHLGNLGVEIVRRDETTDTEANNVSAWLAS